MTMLGRYTLLRRIGSGGVAEVWKARAAGPAGFEKIVAIKRILPDLRSQPELVDMFVDEAKIAARMQHPNIVHVFDFGAAEKNDPYGDDVEYFIAMEYVAGQSLFALLRKLRREKESLSRDISLFITAEVAAGMAYAHSDAEGFRSPVIHRDISPHNILLSYSGRVKILDFGIAKLKDALSQTEPGVIKGKTPYLSPERLAGKASEPRSDLFALGCVLFEALTGRRLFTGDMTVDILDAISQFDPATDDRIQSISDSAIRQLLEKALAPDPEKRFRDAYQMEAALRGQLNPDSERLARQSLASLMRFVFRKYYRREIEEEEEREGATITDPGPSRANPQPTLLRDQNQLSVLVVEPIEDARKEITDSLRGAGYAVHTTGSALQALRLLDGVVVCDIVVADVETRSTAGMKFIEEINSKHPDAELVLMTAHADLDSAVRAAKLGAADYLRKPVQPADILRTVGGLAKSILERKTPTPQVPSASGRYTLMRRIGAGGMGEIWKAKSIGASGFEKIVAIKKILPHRSTRFVDMFVSEAKLVATLQHANIVQVFDFGQDDDGNYFIAMEYVSGPNLARLMRRATNRGRKLPIEVACYVAVEVCKALGHAHSKKDIDGSPLSIVHQDVAPSNVLLSHDGEVKLTDFGIAQLASVSSKSGEFKGTLAYASPEQKAGRGDTRSDLFSLGLILYELLVGERLFDGADEQETRAQIDAYEGMEGHAALEKLPADVASILSTALQPDPEDRYQDAAEMERALNIALGSETLVEARTSLAALIREYFEGRRGDTDGLGEPSPILEPGTTVAEPTTADEPTTAPEPETPPAVISWDVASEGAPLPDVVMIVDDDESTCYLVEQIVASMGHIVEPFVDPDEALNRLVTRGPVDLILADIRMPRMNGFQFRDAVREREGLAHIPFVFLTAGTEEAERAMVERMARQRETILFKPLDMPTFRRAVSSKLGALQKEEGPFTIEALVETFSRIDRRRESGVMTLFEGQTITKIFFRSGKLSMIVSTDPRPTAVISEQSQARLLEADATSADDLSRISKLTDSQKIKDRLKHDVREMFLDVCLCTSGWYEVYFGGVQNEEAPLSAELPIGPLIAEGRNRANACWRVESRLPSWKTTFDIPEPGITEEQLNTRIARALLELVREGKSYEEIKQFTRGSQYPVLVQLGEWLEAGRLIPSEATEEPVAELQDPFAVDHAMPVAPLLASAMVAYRNGALHEAREKLLDVLQLDPGNPLALKRTYEIEETLLQQAKESGLNPQARVYIVAKGKEPRFPYRFNEIAVLERLSESPVKVEQVIEGAELPQNEVLRILLRLSADGVVKVNPAG